MGKIFIESRQYYLMVEIYGILYSEMILLDEYPK